MRIMTKITVNIGNNLRKSYSKYEIMQGCLQPPDQIWWVAGRGGRKRKKKKKRNQKKKPRPKIRPTDGMPNYRQISIPPCLSKIFDEGILVDQLQNLLRHSLYSCVFKYQSLENCLAVEQF